MESRDFLDIDSQRQLIFDNVLGAVSKRYPLENELVSLELSDVRYDKPRPYSIAEQKKAIMDRRNLDWAMRGKWTLRNKSTGEVISEADKVVARVPYLTPRGTFISNGSEYTVSHQQRLRPGIYARQRNNGEVESHVNLIPGTGRSFRAFMDPKSGVFRFRIGQANIPAFTVLRALGADERQMRDSWGDQLYAANAAVGRSFDLDKVYEKLADPRIRQAHSDPTSGLRAIFSRMKIDPEVSSRTLGKPYDLVNHESLLRATQRLLNIHRGAEDPDDRDSQANQTLVSPEDVLAERVTKDAGQLSRKLLWKVSGHKDVNRIPSGYLTRQVYSALLSSGLGQPLSEINPIEILDQLVRVSRTGDGGISGDAVSEETRNVQPSQLGLIDPIRAPESQKIGLDSRVTINTRKGRDGMIYRTVMNPRTGKDELVSSGALVSATVAFPMEMERSTRKVRAMTGGKIRYVDRADVDYVIPSGNDMFSVTSNLVPGISGIKGGRLLMASKMFTQALPLKDAEAPLVQAGTPDGQSSFEKLYGKYGGAVFADQPGTVVKADTEGVTLKLEDGQTKTYELYDNFPNNAKTLTHNTLTVKVGDQVNPGQLLARSNFTDDKGTLALGANFRVAFMAFKGANYEDGIVISESAAKRMSSEHLYQSKLDLDDEALKVSRTDFLSQFPGRFNKEQLATIDDNGLVKPGTVVRDGDPLALAVAQRSPTRGTAIVRQKRNWTTDQSLTWNHHTDGVVTDVSRTHDGLKVAVKSYMPMQVGDKLSGRWGNKGVISAIESDDRMPRDKDGKAFEVLLNPLGIISRVNASQLVETSLAKIARKTGEPYKLPAFSADNMTRYALEELAKHGMSDTEDVTDPQTNRQLKDVFTGEQFLMKLHHTSESKMSGRDTGGYTSDQSPAKGGQTGSKRLGNLDMNALIAHGSTEVIRDAKLIRGQRNDSFWRNYRMGLPVQMPNQPFVYDKFLASLQASGVNVDRRADGLHIMAMNDAGVDELAEGRELSNADAINLKDEQPVPGGLFDMKLTGGREGNRWSSIPLVEPLPHPLMEEPIRRLLGMTGAAFEEFLKSEDGPQKLQQRLGAINVDNEIEKQREIIRSGRVSKRDNAVKLLRYLDAARRSDTHPKDWMMTKVPVLPPMFRPITLVKGMEMTSDANLLYKELFEANRNLADIRGEVQDVGDERLATYNALKAVIGLGDPVNPKLQEKSVSGLLAHIFGKGSPKQGMYQRKLMSTTTDSVGRSVITPDPKLDMDQVGLPESTAWMIYRPHVMRRLARKYNTGDTVVPLVDLAKWIQDKDPRAREALVDEMKVRPVIYNRAPVLHKYGILGAWPTLVKGDTLRISPINTKGFGGDFDGDAHVNSVYGVFSERIWIDLMVQSGYKEIPMPANFQTQLVSYNLKPEGYHACVLYLSDFPHAELIGQKDHIDFFRVPEGAFVVAINEETGTPCLAPVAGWSVHRDREVEIVTLAGGHQIVTDDDERAVYGLDNQTLEWVRRRPSEASGVMVPIVDTAPIATSPITHVSLDCYQGSNGNNRSHDIVESVPLTWLTGYAIGAHIGDGWCDDQRKIHLANNSGRVARTWMSGICQFIPRGGRRASFRCHFSTVNKLPGSKGSTKYSTSWSHLCNVLRDWIGPKSYHKHLPPFWISSPRAFRVGILAGMLDTDGTVNLSKATDKKKPQFHFAYTSNSLRLLQETQHLLRTLRVVSSITATRTPAGKDFWCLAISSPDVYRELRTELHLQHPQKAEVVREFFRGTPPGRRNLNKRLFPTPARLMSAIGKYAYQQGDNTICTHARECAGRGYSSQYGAERLREYLHLADWKPPTGLTDLWDKWCKLFNPFVHYEAVTNVEKTGIVETGYDLTVPGFETFMSVDGIILSNTMNFHVPTTDEAIRDVVDKMMPSKNLFSTGEFDVHLLPQQEYLLGLYAATRDPDTKTPSRAYAKAQDMIQAFLRGEIGVNTSVTINE